MTGSRHPSRSSAGDGGQGVVPPRCRSTIEKPARARFFLLFLLPALAMTAPLRLDATTTSVPLAFAVGVLSDEDGRMRIEEVAALPDDAPEPTDSSGEHLNFSAFP